jgi:hypothetical protein
VHARTGEPGSVLQFGVVGLGPAGDAGGLQLGLCPGLHDGFINPGLLNRGLVAGLLLGPLGGGGLSGGKVAPDASHDGLGLRAGVRLGLRLWQDDPVRLADLGCPLMLRPGSYPDLPRTPVCTANREASGKSVPSHANVMFMRFRSAS